MERHASFLTALAADGPDAQHAEKLMLFGQFVGSWDFTWRDIGGDDPAKGTGEWHFGWVLQGRAVQDVWIAHNADESLHEYGSTLRFYDPRIDRWRISWNGPVKGNLRAFEASVIGDEIVLEGRNADGNLVHWIFSDVTPMTFRWRGEISNDAGVTWMLNEEMRLTRRARP